MTIPTPDTEPLELTTLAQGDEGPREAVSTVLRDHAALAEFFNGEPPAEHAVDWDREVVTVIALGPRAAGSSVTIEEIQFWNLGIRGGTADVYFREVAGDAVEDAVSRDELGDAGPLGASADEVGTTDTPDGVLDQDVAGTPPDEATQERITYPFHAVRSAAFGHASFHPARPVDMPEALFRHWRGPIQKDDHGVGLYLPREHAPLSRSVAGFSVDRSGSFVAVHDAPGDGPVEVPGHWRPSRGGLAVELEDGRSFTIHVVSVDEHELRARKEDSDSSCS